MWLCARLLVVAFCLGATWAHAAPLGVVGKDDRRVIEPNEQRQWNAVGRLNRANGGFCSAVLIGPSEALTAAHCLWDQKRKRWLLPDMIHFVPGYRRGSYLGHAKGKSFRFSETLIMDDQGKPVDQIDDWAVIQLDLDLKNGAGIKPLKLAGPNARLALHEDNRLMRVGYGRDRPHLPVVVERCDALGSMSEGQLLLHNCDATFGDSGSPILARRNGEIVVMGIQSSLIGFGDDVAGVAIFVERRLPLDALTKEN